MSESACRNRTITVASAQTHSKPPQSESIDSRYATWHSCWIVALFKWPLQYLCTAMLHAVWLLHTLLRSESTSNQDESKWFAREGRRHTVMQNASLCAHSTQHGRPQRGEASSSLTHSRMLQKVALENGQPPLFRPSRSAKQDETKCRLERSRQQRGAMERTARDASTEM
jgi:hypothetical protein